MHFSGQSCLKYSEKEKNVPLRQDNHDKTKRDETKHKTSGTPAIPRPIRGWDDKSRRIHRIRREIRRVPWWIWAAIPLLLTAGFAAGGLWFGGRSSALTNRLNMAEAELGLMASEYVDPAEFANLTAEHLALSQLSAELRVEQERLAAELLSSVPASELSELTARYELVSAQLADVEVELEELKPQLASASARVEQLEQIELTLERQLDFQTTRANQLQATQTAERLALPGQLVDQFNTSPPLEIGNYQLAVSQEILRESFGIRFGSINDETLAVIVGGTAVFGLADQPASLGGPDEIKLGLPRLIVAGLTGFTPDSYDYDAGFLARVGDQDVSDLMVWVEANVLQPEACGDVASLRGVVAQAESRLQIASGDHDLKIVWVDSTGRSFQTSQLSNAILLGEAC